MRSVSLLLSFLLFTTVSYADSSKTYPKKELQDVVNQAEEGTVFLFDLDDTLFTTKNRNMKILTEFVSGKSNCVDIESLCRHVKRNLSSRHLEWNFTNTLKNLGFSDENIKAFAPKYKTFWGPRFFGNSYLKYDELNPGAKDYVQKIFKKGATIFYLTGRNDADMRKGTEEAIRRAGLPFDHERVHLMLKPGDADDTEFKKTVFESVAKLGRLVAAYENEPDNIMAMADFEGFKGGAFFFLDTLNSGKGVTTLASRPDLIWAVDFETK